MLEDVTVPTVFIAIRTKIRVYGNWNLIISLMFNFINCSDDSYRPKIYTTNKKKIVIMFTKLVLASFIQNIDKHD